MALNWKDGAATLITAGVVGLYAAFLADVDLPLIGNARAVAAAAFVLGVTACIVGTRVPLTGMDRAGGMLTWLSRLSSLAALAALVTVLTGSEVVLAVQVGSTVLLWLAATVRHTLGIGPVTGDRPPAQPGSRLAA